MEGPSDYLWSRGELNSDVRSEVYGKTRMI